MNRFEFNLVKEERVGEVLHVGGDGELPFQPKVELPQASFHLLRQRVHSLTLLENTNICEKEDLAEHLNLHFLLTFLHFQVRMKFG